MKYILTVLLIIAAGSCIAFAAAKNENTVNTETSTQGGFMDKKILVAYFSWSGNTKSIAEKIQAKTNADIFEITPLEPYPSDYNRTAYGVAKMQKDKGIHPPINNTDITPYDVIFVGTPAWWYTMAPPVMTFLAENNFESKVIIPFITHGGGGGYTIDKDMVKLAKGSTVLKPIIIYENGNASTDKEITEWLNNTKI